MLSDLILLVEDDPDDEELTLSTLQEHHVGRVHVVRDGCAALDYLHGQCPEVPRVVLLDLKLPKLHGIDVLRSIRSDPRTELLPVVIMTSSRQEEDRLKSYRGGANSFVTKPIEFERFRDAVRQLSLYWMGLNETVDS